MRSTTGGERGAETSPREPGTERDALGPVRSTHAPLPLWRAVLPVAMSVVIIVFVNGFLFAKQGQIGTLFAVTIPVAAAAFFLFAWAPIRMRHLRITLHAHGVVVSTPHKSDTEDVILFDDVDEVWFILESMRSWLGTVALMDALRLVKHDESSHLVPLHVRGGFTIAKEILRACSHPLRADASRTVRDGGTLTFGNVALDRIGLRTTSWAITWSELRLVRYLPGRVALFRRQTVFPWRNIRLDQVPHPTIFAKLVTEYAPKVEVDDPLGTLRD
ncbi:hypothetical protein LVJ94_28805 [Pendulispora rubella]|uniref:Uncharacterized protein n=1 Tax=Pendulispora rubella TaxID=2741070 RepID=A0ABZ2KS87_9BACT